MTTQLIFEQPPATVRGPRTRNIPRDTAKRLKEHPRQWVRVYTAPSRAAAYATAHQIRKGVLASFRPAGSYEATGRTVDGQFRVYVRYIGEDGEHA